MTFATLQTDNYEQRMSKIPMSPNKTAINKLKSREKMAIKKGLHPLDDGTNTNNLVLFAMIRNMPSRMRRVELYKYIVSIGLSTDVIYIYVPINFDTGCNTKRFGFIGFRNQKGIKTFYEQTHNISRNKFQPLQSVFHQYKPQYITVHIAKIQGLFHNLRYGIDIRKNILPYLEWMPIIFNKDGNEINLFDYNLKSDDICHHLVKMSQYKSPPKVQKPHAPADFTQFLEYVPRQIDPQPIITFCDCYGCQQWYTEQSTPITPPIEQLFTTTTFCEEYIHIDTPREAGWE